MKSSSVQPIKEPKPAAGIRDTSAQDVARERPKQHFAWLKWGVPAAIGAVVLVLLALAVTRWLGTDASVSADRIRIATVTRGDFVRDVSVQGRVVAAVSPTLYSSAAGTVTLLVQPGDSVAAGEPVAELDSPEIQSEFEQESSTLAQLAAELERQRIQARKAEVLSQQEIDLAKVTLNAADREKRRADESIKTNAISQIDYERARDELATAQVRHEHALQDARLESESLAFEIQTRELALQRQQQLVDNLARRVDELTLTSPVDGIVGNVAVQQKAVVPANTPLVTVVDLSAFEIEVNIPETYADDLGLGMPAEVLYGGQEMPGELVSLSPEVIDSQVVGRIRFAGDAPPGLRQNQRVTVRIVMDQLDDVLKLPRGSFADSGSGRYAFVLAGDGTAVKRPVTLGARSVAEVEVVSGLAEGDQVIVSGLPDITDVDVLQVVD